MAELGLLMLELSRCSSILSVVSIEAASAMLRGLPDSLMLSSIWTSWAGPMERSGRAEVNFVLNVVVSLVFRFLMSRRSSCAVQRKLYGSGFGGILLVGVE